MRYAQNDPRDSFVVWKCMLKYVLLVQLNILYNMVFMSRMGESKVYSNILFSANSIVLIESIIYHCGHHMLGQKIRT